MPVFQIVILGGWLMVRYVIAPGAQEVYKLVQQQLSAGPIWRAGPKLSLSTVLADIAHTNFLANEYARNGCRLRFSLTWRGHPTAVLKVREAILN
mmetsp:Transcript_3515/g.5962  ORF Transcript_3515/g.5962 Transcript_3515/m.5962 type:complete len:95 (+) Transcript_3515:232-516(+)